MKGSDLLKLLRVKQWYKNSVIFISIIFSFNLFNKNLILLSFFGFISLCFISSSFYIINDIVDRKKDRHHPEKKDRPIASKKIGIPLALVSSFVLFGASLLIAYNLSVFFLYSILALFILSLIYSCCVRKILFLDIIFISINFVIRAVSGTFIIDYPVSFWVILSTFFISVFLVSGKRIAELDLAQIGEYRSVYDKSSRKALEYLMILSLTNVFVFFSIYSILTERPALLISLPLALYIAISFFNEIYKNPFLIRNPEKFISKDKNLLAILIWLVILIDALYLFYI